MTDTSTELEPLRRQTALVENAERMLAQAAGDPVKLGDVIRQSEAARVLARQVKLGDAAINSATAVKLRAEVRLADAIDAARDADEMARPGDNQWSGGSDSEPPLTYRDIGTNKVRVFEARTIRDHLGPTSDEAETAIIAEAEEATSNGREFTRSGILDRIRSKTRATARTEAVAQHKADMAEMREFAASVTPDDYDPTEDQNSAAVQRAILTAVHGVEALDMFTADDVRQALNHSNPKVRDIVLPAYTGHLRTIVNIADRFRELL